MKPAWAAATLRLYMFLAANTAAMAMASPLQADHMQAATLSGAYGPLLISVRGDRVQGVFSEQRGDGGPGGGAQFSCVFRLNGILDGHVAKVSTQTVGESETIAGRLTFSADGVRLVLDKDQDGCGMTSGSMTGDGFQETRGTPGYDWIDVGVVTSPKAVLHAGPGVVSSGKPYLVDADAVAVLAEQDEWAKVRFVSGTRPTTGWLKLTDVALASEGFSARK